MFRSLASVATLAAFLVYAGISSAHSASNTVPETRIESDSLPITANDLKPAECSALDLLNIVTGEGRISGTQDNDLIIGSLSADDIDGKNGDDCVVASGGDDKVAGGKKKGSDILLGGEGNDELDGDDGIDVCYGGPGTNTFVDCETVSDP